jgi:predicted Holliday junction resolvase-like endonuclease
MDFSRDIALKWKQEPQHIKQQYKDRANVIKEEHKLKYPDFKYLSEESRRKSLVRKRNNLLKKRMEELMAPVVPSNELKSDGTVTSGEKENEIEYDDYLK